VSAVTLRRWLRGWRKGGYEALVPGIRRQSNRIPAQVLEAAVTIKREAPGRSAAQVVRVLAETGRGKVAERTLQRHFMSTRGWQPAKNGMLRIPASWWHRGWTSCAAGSHTDASRAAWACSACGAGRYPPPDPSSRAPGAW
jgi:hypothetical protein